MKFRLASLLNHIPGKEQVFFQKFIQTLKQERIPLEIVAPGGEVYASLPGDVQHRLVIRDTRFFKALIHPNAFSLGQAYVKGYFDVSGSIRDLYEMAWEKLLHASQPRNLKSWLSRLFVNIREQERENIEFHYDVPCNFYRLFLGETMGYTCGYYPDKETTLSQAQNEKMEIICRKLRLQPGEHLLDIGCGWGNFAVHAALHYQVRVTGITLSSEQKAYADQWIQTMGLGDLVCIKILNYRDLGREEFDKIACIGMSEHVGQAHMKGFYRTLYHCLKQEGLFLQHTITTQVRRKKGEFNSFLDTFMFPGGELLQEQELIHMAAGSGFELIQAENFRPHYIRTLADWISRMEVFREKLLQVVSEQIYRVYHVFFIGSLISFRQKEIALFQNLFYKSSPVSSKPDESPSHEAAMDYFLTPFAKTLSKDRAPKK